MAAENIDNTVNGTGLFPAKVPGLSDAADIQAALRLYHYGTYAYDGANTNPTLLPNPSIAKHLQNLVDADAAEVTNRNAAITAHSSATTNIHGISNTANLATQTYVNTAISAAVGGVTGEFSNLAGTAIDWNSVDERFDVEPRLANSGTVITKTESFILSASDVGKTAILYSSNPITVTLPANASVEIPVGYSIDIIQTGTGSVTVSEGSSAVSINSKSNIKSLDGQYSKGTLVKIADNTWFFFGNLLNVVTPVTPTAPTPVAPTPVAPTPVAPTPTPPAPTPVAPTPVAPTPVAPTPVAPTPTPPQLATPSLSVTSQGWNSYPNAAYANITVGNYNYDNTYTSTIGTQNPEFPEEWNLGNLNPNQSYTVYITASRAGYTSAQGSITFSANPASTPTPVAPTPVAPTPTGPTTYNIYTYCDPLFPSMRGGAYGTQTAGTTVNTGTTSTQGLTSEQIVAQLGYAGGCPTVPIVNPGTVYLSYCIQGSPVVESFPINADNVLTTNINEACSVYSTLLTNIGATSIDCSTSSARVAPTNCATAPTPVAPTPVAPTPTAPTPVATGYYAWGCCNGDPLVIDGPNNTTARADYQSVGGCTAAGVLSTYAAALSAAQERCNESSPTPTPPTTTYYLAQTTIDFQNDDCVSAPAYVSSQTTAPATVGSIYSISSGSRTLTTGYWSTVSAADAVAQLLAGTSRCQTPTPVAPTPVAPTPVAPTPTPPTSCTMPSVVGLSEGSASNAITSAGIAYEFTYEYGNSQGATAQNNGTVAAQDPAPGTVGSCGYTVNATLYIYRYTAPTPVAPTPVAPTPVAPTPVAPTPTASYPTLLPGLHYCASGDVPNPSSPCTQTDVNNGNCKDGGASGPSCAPAPVAPTPVAPTPVAPTPTGGSATCPGQSTNPALYTCAELGLTRLGGSDYYSIPAGWSCCSAPAPVAPTPVAPTPVAPTPTAPLDCSPCDPQYSGGSCGQYGNGTLCYTPSGCPNRCDGDHPPTPTAPAPVAPVAPTAPSRYTCSPSDYANQCCSCFSVGACDANGSSWPAC